MSSEAVRKLGLSGQREFPELLNWRREANPDQTLSPTKSTAYKIAAEVADPVKFVRQFISSH